MSPNLLAASDAVRPGEENGIKTIIPKKVKFGRCEVVEVRSWKSWMVDKNSLWWPQSSANENKKKTAKENPERERVKKQCKIRHWIKVLGRRLSRDDAVQWSKAYIHSNDAEPQSKRP